MENTQNILVLATNTRTDNDKQLISRVLNQKSEIRQWNIDQEDIDCVLRIESDTLSEEEIINIIDSNNFKCSPLE